MYSISPKLSTSGLLFAEKKTQLYAHTQVLNCFVFGISQTIFEHCTAIAYTLKHTTYYEHNLIIRYIQCAVTGYYLRSRIIYFRLLNTQNNVDDYGEDEYPFFYLTQYRTYIAIKLYEWVHAGDMMGTNNKRNNGASALEKELCLCKQRYMLC